MSKSLMVEKIRKQERGGSAQLHSSLLQPLGFSQQDKERKREVNREIDCNGGRHGHER